MWRCAGSRAAEKTTRWHFNCPGRENDEAVRQSTEHKFSIERLCGKWWSVLRPCAIWSWINWLVKNQDSYRWRRNGFAPRPGSGIAFKFKLFWLSTCLVALTDFLLLPPYEIRWGGPPKLSPASWQCKRLYATRTFTPEFKILFNENALSAYMPCTCSGTEKVKHIESRQITHVGAASTHWFK